MKKFQKKQVIVYARQWEGGNYQWLEDACGMNWGRADVKADWLMDVKDKENVVIYNTIERQWLKLPVGHYLIIGVRGEIYSCAPDIFKETYEPA